MDLQAPVEAPYRSWPRLSGQIRTMPLRHAQAERRVLVAQSLAWSSLDRDWL
jgi:hypothetical protein